MFICLRFLKYEIDIIIISLLRNKNSYLRWNQKSPFYCNSATFVFWKNDVKNSSLIRSLFFSYSKISPCLLLITVLSEVKNWSNFCYFLIYGIHFLLVNLLLFQRKHVRLLKWIQNILTKSRKLKLLRIPR